MALAVPHSVSASADSVTSVQTAAMVVSSGSLIVVATNNYEGAGGVDAATPITDTSGNTYTRVGVSTNVRSSNCELFYAKNVTGGASVQFTYTLTGTGYPRILVIEVTGADTTAPLDQGSNSSFTSTATFPSSLTSPSITTTQADTILVASGMDIGANNTVTWSDGGCTNNSGAWTKPQAISNGSTQEGAIGYAIVSSTGQYCVNYAFSPNSNFCAVGIASFKAATGGGGGAIQPPRSMDQFRLRRQFRQERGLYLPEGHDRKIIYPSFSLRKAA